jgi:hypothetical protein
VDEKLQKKLKNNNFKEHIIMGALIKEHPQQCSQYMTLPIKIGSTEVKTCWFGSTKCDSGSAFLYTLPRLVKGTTLLPCTFDRRA